VSRAGTVTAGSWWFGRGWLPWPTATADTVDVDDAGIGLRPVPGGPRDVGAANGTLGGLVLPPTLAAGHGTLWLAGRRLRRFDPVTGRFRDLPGRDLGPGTTIAALSGLLAVADPDRHEVIVLSALTLGVHARLPLGDRRPLSMAGHGDRLAVLDDHGTVRLATPALDRLVPVARPRPSRATRWHRIVLDRDGHFHLLGDTVDRSLFDPPAVAVDHLGRFRIPAAFRLADRPDPGCFDHTGEPVVISPDESPGPRGYAGTGTWTGKPLDSHTLGCRWHRTTLTGTVPPGCAVTLRTYASDEPFDATTLPDESWSTPLRIAGVPQPAAPADSAVREDFAVLAGRGRYLSVRIGLAGTGWTTPVVGDLLVEPQVPGLERFLPAIYRSDEQNTDFLRRFLAIFAAELDGLEQAIRELPTRFSPAAVREPWLNSLAAELGVPVERGWTAGQRRTLLVAAPPLYPVRGTPAAIRALLRTHLEAALRQPVPEHVPALVEGFRERPEALLGSARLPAGEGTGLWSASVVDRPRLGAPGRHAQIRLVSVGDRLTDRFRVYANRYTVIVPRPYLNDSATRDRFARLVAAETPAHIAHEIVTVEPRTVLGAQGRLGLDTYVGAVPPARLAGPDRTGARLGHGLRLGDRARYRPPTVGRGGYLGVQTVVI